MTISVGAASAFDVPGLLLSLDRYPYGCAEQTTSRALPLLYLNTVAAAIGVTGEEKAKERVQAAIDRLFEMQDSSGAFGLWGPANGETWLSAYVTDFLTRAKEQGYQVPALAFRQALDKLANGVAIATDFQSGGEDIAYSLYVLARNGRAPIGDLRYYADTRIANFSSALAKAQIGAALAMLGDKERAEKVFAVAIDAIGAPVADADRGDYGSNLRDSAATMTLVSETNSKGSLDGKLASIIASARRDRLYTSTQENAWMLLASRALLEEGKTLKLSVNGQPFEGMLNRKLTEKDLANGPLVIENLSDGDIQAMVTVTGEAATPEPAADHGLKVERSYFKLDGTPVDLSNAQTAALSQNDRLVVVLKVAATDGSAGRVMLVDHLPAGLEIENPHLVDGGDAGSLSWLTPGITPEHTEFRDDRFVATFTTDQLANAVQVAYVVRAVTPGLYVNPSAYAEDMYRPERFGRGDSGKLRVKPAG